MNPSRRSAVLGGVALGALSAVPLGGSRVFAAPPPGRVVRVGMLTSGAPIRWDMVETATAAGLRDAGYIEGKNLELVRRNATYPDQRMQTHTQELVERKVDVIVTSCTWSTMLATKMTGKIPIVMGSIINPVERGFVRSLARPGTNVTGQTGHFPDLAPKMLEYVRVAMPGAKTIGILSNSKNPLHLRSMRNAEEAARALGLKAIDIDLHRFSNREATREVLRESGAQLVLVLPDDDLYFEFLQHVFPVSAELRVPTFFTKRDLVDVGGVFSYGVDSVAIFRRNAFFIDRIVNGLNPAECPVENPTKLEFAVNLKRAAEYGIDVPRAALMRAHYVVK